MSIWTEKYRPKSFDDIKGQDVVVQRVRAFLKNRNMPHLLFTGPAGVGKTSMSLVIARELYGDNWRENFLELNASDERGIDVVRSTVKDFARTKAMGDVPFKVIYLDECDALTREAQQALRRTMEMYTNGTRFILSCNYSSKIIDPIQSRCAVFRFRPLPQESMETIVDGIVKTEGLVLAADAKAALIQVADGDCRKLANVMQSVSAMGGQVSAKDVFALASVAEPKEVDELVKLAVSGKFIEARDKLTVVMIAYGMSGLDVIRQLQKVVWALDVPPRVKVSLVDKCGEIEFRMVEGADEFVQLEALLAAFWQAGSQK